MPKQTTIIAKTTTGSQATFKLKPNRTEAQTTAAVDNIRALPGIKSIEAVSYQSK